MMDANEIEKALEAYGAISDHAAKMLRDNPEYVHVNDRYLPRPYASDFSRLYVAGDTMYGEAWVWTNTTGGSNEDVTFSIPMSEFMASFEEKEDS